MTFQSSFWHLILPLVLSPAQGLNKPVAGFSSFVKHYLDPCLAANVCTKFMKDFSAGVNEFDEMTPVLRKNFDCLRKSSLKLLAYKFEFGMTKFNYLGSTIFTTRYLAGMWQNSKILMQIRMPTSVKQVKRLAGFVQFFLRSFMHNLMDKLLHFIVDFGKILHLQSLMITMNHLKL